MVVDFIIEVTDINDNSPEFRPEVFELNIPENALSGRHFQLPNAFDKDTGPDNGVQEYTILAGGDELFGLHKVESGANSTDIYLMLISTLNRETAPSYEVSHCDGTDVISGPKVGEILTLRKIAI